VGAQPLLDRWALVGAVVVADQVHVQLDRHLPVDLGEELLEFDRAMLPVRRADHRSVGGVERREQAGRAVADVVVGPLLGHALVINYRSAQFCRTRKQVNRLRPAQFRG
jgi:hypothetical protein